MRLSVQHEALASPAYAASRKFLTTYTYFPSPTAQAGLKKKTSGRASCSMEISHQQPISSLTFRIVSLPLSLFKVICSGFSSSPLTHITIMTSNTKQGYSGHCENVFFSSVLMKQFPLSVSLADSNQSPGATIFF